MIRKIKKVLLSSVLLTGALVMLLQLTPRACAAGTKQWHNDVFSSKENRCVKIDKNGASIPQ